MNRLRVRVYKVRFGDGILITVPDHDPETDEATKRHIFIDFGNVLSSAGGDDSVFRPVFEDVVRELEGRALDLYVMTHEHLDHVQGLPYLARDVFADGELKQRLSVTHAWLTPSAADGYYERHPEAKKAFDSIERYLTTAPRGIARHFRSIMMNNSPYQTSACVDFLKDLAAQPHYVHRETDLRGKHNFKEARFSIWAPEEDTSTYYGRFQPMGLLEAAANASSHATGGDLPRQQPPPGVDGTAFYNLVDSLQRGFVDNILAIDKAKNNTSIVFSLEWRGWRLLFPGDAEERSWKTIHREHRRIVGEGGEPLMKPVHFLKVSHHGSHNGTPKDEILDVLLPAVAPDDRERHAVISSFRDTYDGIPHEPTNLRLEERCTLHSTIDAPGLYVDTEFEG